MAYAPQMNGPRCTANFLASDIASVDIDDAESVEAVLQHPLVRDYAGLVYTTPSHTEEKPRLRVVFVLPRTITKADQMKAVNRSLTLRLSGTRPPRMPPGSASEVGQPGPTSSTATSRRLSWMS